jgi:hypothetical protein
MQLLSANSAGPKIHIIAVHVSAHRGYFTTTVINRLIRPPAKLVVQLGSWRQIGLPAPVRPHCIMYTPPGVPRPRTNFTLKFDACDYLAFLSPSSCRAIFNSAYISKSSGSLGSPMTK